MKKLLIAFGVLAALAACEKAPEVSDMMTTVTPEAPSSGKL